MNILALNAGSSTLKYKLISTDSEKELLAGSEEHSGADMLDNALQKVLARSQSLGVDGVGHRVVHGGDLFSTPIRIDDSVVRSLKSLRDLDPLHNPLEVSLVETARRLAPELPAAAVFDTAFHSTIPDTAALYAIPYRLSAQLKLRRYGFHGISYKYVSQLLLSSMGRSAAGSRLIVCHLGSGASACAIKDGVSVDTSMGLTPLEGLVMGTRCGDLDPGLLLYLLQAQQMTAADIDHLLNHDSGLKGLSGLSSDLRELEKAAGDGVVDSERALNIFAYRLRKYIGSYAAAMGGVDAIAFTGGIGEHSWRMRARTLKGLQFLGAELDPGRNAAASEASALISTPGPPCRSGASLRTKSCRSSGMSPRCSANDSRQFLARCRTASERCTQTGLKP